MDNFALQLEQLKNPDWSIRFKACQELKTMPNLPDEAVTALLEASHDPNVFVANEAKQVLKKNEPSRYEINESEFLAGNKDELLSKHYNDMQNEIGSWGKAFVIFGIINLVNGITSSDLGRISFGISLLVISLLSVYFRDELGMFIVFFWALILASFTNILGGYWFWGIVAILSAIFSFIEYRKFSPVRSIYQPDQNVISAVVSKRRATLAQRRIQLSWLSLLMGGIGFVGICVGLIVGGMYGVAGKDPYWIGYYGGGVLLSFSHLGLPVGIAAVISYQKPKVAAIVGIVMSSLFVLFFLCSVVYFTMM